MSYGESEYSLVEYSALVDSGGIKLKGAVSQTFAESIIVPPPLTVQGALSNSSADTINLSQTADLQTLGAFALSFAEILDANIEIIQGENSVSQSFASSLSIVQLRFQVARFYQVILTGSQDATTDIVIPVSNFTARLREPGESFLNCTIPDGLSIESQINARLNGQLVAQLGVKRSDGTTIISELARVDLETVDSNQLSGEHQISLSGHRAISFVNPQPKKLSSVRQRRSVNGVINYKGIIEDIIFPNDTVTVGIENIVPTSVVLTVSRNPPAQFVEIST